MNFDKFNPLSENFIYKSTTTKNNSNIPKQSTINENENTADILKLNSEVSDWGIDEDFTPNTGTTFSNFLSPTSSNATSSHTHPTNVSLSQQHPSQQLQQQQQQQHIYHTRHHHQPSTNSHHSQQQFDEYFPPNPTYIKSIPRRNSSISNSSYYNSNNIHQSPLNPHQQLHRTHSQQSLNAIHFLQQSGNVITPTTESLQKFIKKYLSMENKSKEFWEKFKYSLIISNLLEDSMILSENESSLKILKTDVTEERYRRFKYLLNDDGTKLIVKNTSYRITYNLQYDNFSIIIIITNLIIYLLKQQQNLRNGKDCMNNVLQFKLFKIILYLSSKLIKIRKFKIMIKTNQILDLTNNFLKLNYQINKNLILNMIQIKGSNLNLNISIDQKQLTQFLLNSLNFLIINLNILITKLLPLMNGEILEQYCVINNINLGILTQNFENDDANEIQEIQFYINKFNQLRKFLICQLLTINENVNINFFILNLIDQFNTEEETKDLNNLEKFNILIEVFKDYNKSIENINEMFKKYNNYKLEPTTNKEEPNNNSNLNLFISKISNLNQNLKYFKKYINNNSSTTTDSKDQEEKISIFNQFNNELNNLKTLHKQTLIELNQNLNPEFQNNSISKSSSNISSPSQSITKDSSSSSFNLKSFQNPSLKKRFSLPLSNNSPITPKPSTTINNSPSQSEPITRKKYNNRLSNGLPLGLLTVFEENQLQQSQQNQFETKRDSSLSSNSYQLQPSLLQQPPKLNYENDYENLNLNENYNKLTLDQLNNDRKSNSNNNQNNFIMNNRFSLNSVQSNVSGITDLISTQLTSFKSHEEENEDEQVTEDQEFSTINESQKKEEFKKHLENKFKKLYAS
ncbi:uncharacterized protein KGF55_003473 [Candida pseudojiufengensis]|uniref:uncharacterized protein n=1 Tax=Candida pseudojiufengensis TaxID=497109 RepID=UPI00222511BF|nr:uncharacterized protein KGF55_003473 [Candida pseudojiufengensis]KAI5962397.1 hypothetical protein KGF55_003473 [Candida pseudojiufengensis]